MFISVLDLFKVGIGPSSSHTMGPMLAARSFSEQAAVAAERTFRDRGVHVRCTLKGSLAFTGRGHGTDRAVTLGMHGYTPLDIADAGLDSILDGISGKSGIRTPGGQTLGFIPAEHIVFDPGKPLPQHPNGMIFEMIADSGEVLLSETCFSIGGGFISTAAEIDGLVAPLDMKPGTAGPYPFDSARLMLQMAEQSGLGVAEMKRANETRFRSDAELDRGLDRLWQAMQQCVRSGLGARGRLPGGLRLERRAGVLFEQLLAGPGPATVNEWLCAYAMAVNEENAAGHMVVTAPTNGAAGVLPAVLFYFVNHENGTPQQVREFLLTAAAIGGLIKHRSSISGAEVGCQGEVGSASSMAAAGLCAVRGGTAPQIENAAEIALEHHLGMTCDPVNGLVQVPCIERNGFGAIKAYTAASLAIRGSGHHFMPLDNCIEAMRQTGLEMSAKYKETSLGGLAVSITEC